MEEEIERNKEENIEDISKEIKQLEEKKQELENKKSIEEIKEETPEEPKSIKEDKAGKKKEGSFMPFIFIMLFSFAIISLWDKVPQIKNSVHFILDPSFGFLLDWNLNFGFLIIVLFIAIFTTIVQKYATDQKTLKEMKKEQKAIQKKIKEFKHDPKKAMELQKENMKMLPRQMKLSMRSIAYTGIPFILFYRWFFDYFGALEEYKLWLGMGWILFYIVGLIIIGQIFRKWWDVV